MLLEIPKLRRGGFLPSIIEPRRRIDRALWAVVMEAYVAGVSTRSVDDLVAALGAESGISRSEVSRICGGLDEVVEAFRTRRLDHVEFPYVYLDATYLNVRNNLAQPASMATVVATGITADGNREVLGCDVGDSETEAFWQQFLGSLRDRGLTGVRLVISDAHRGLAAAADRWFQGAAQQRCRVHFIRNLLAAVPRAHWQKIWSTNPLERINKEIKRRSRVVGIFPNEASAIRLAGAILAGAILADLHDEWQATDRRYLSEDSMSLLYPERDTTATAELTVGNHHRGSTQNPTT